MDLLLPIILH